MSLSDFFDQNPHLANNTRLTKGRVPTKTSSWKGPCSHNLGLILEDDGNLADCQCDCESSDESNGDIKDAISHNDESTDTLSTDESTDAPEHSIQIANTIQIASVPNQSPVVNMIAASRWCCGCSIGRTVDAVLKKCFRAQRVQPVSSRDERIADETTDAPEHTVQIADVPLKNARCHHICYPVSVETRWNKWVRNPSRSHRAVVSTCLFILLAVSFLPLFWTGTSSFQTAHDVCSSRFSTLRLELDVETYDPERAIAFLFPGHVFKICSAAMSFLANCAWLYRSPYQQEGSRNLPFSSASRVDAQSLDTALGTFFGMQFVVGISITVLQQARCTESAMVYRLYSGADIIIGYTISGIFMHLLGQRFLLEKSRTIVASMVGEENAIESARVKMLERTLRWERYLATSLIVPCVTFSLGYEGITFAIVGVIALSIMVADLVFSITVTMVFLRPIKLAMRDKAGPRSGREKRLLHTMRMTLAGTSIIVFSSTFLYLNVFASVTWPSLLAHPWSHPKVFGGRFAAMLTDVGMLLASGIIFKVELPRCLRNLEKRFRMYSLSTSTAATSVADSSSPSN